jgi:hypothetical protein
VIVAGGHALQSGPLSCAARTPIGRPVTTTAESMLGMDTVSRSFGDSLVGHNGACTDLPDRDFHGEDSSMDTVASIGEVGRRALGRGQRKLSTCRRTSPRWQPKGVLRVNERRIFDATHLEDILVWVAVMNGAVPEAYVNASETRSIRFFNLPDVTLKISRPALRKLDGKLRNLIGLSVLVSLSIGFDSQSLAVLLAGVAAIISNAGTEVHGMVEEEGQLGLLACKISTEYAMASVEQLARLRGYEIQTNNVPWQEMHRVLRSKDTGPLFKVFLGSLGLARANGSTTGTAYAPDPRQETDNDHEGLIYGLEREFAAINPIPDAVSPTPGHQLSPESYSNLTSVATRLGWTPTEVLGLIDAHLNPGLLPDLVYHSATVSGADWIRLYQWLRRSDRAN